LQEVQLLGFAAPTQVKQLELHEIQLDALKVVLKKVFA
jgi:hypothetical protein